MYWESSPHPHGMSIASFVWTTIQRIPLEQMACMAGSSLQIVSRWFCDWAIPPHSTAIPLADPSPRLQIFGAAAPKICNAWIRDATRVQILNRFRSGPRRKVRHLWAIARRAAADELHAALWMSGVCIGWCPSFRRRESTCGSPADGRRRGRTADVPSVGVETWRFTRTR